ncbi:metacaspase-1-like [Cyclospora cayetanensis]|uniref:Metacaspase-1-like n=1 Tax=Cyclospora cayetanensis TaxID=88456 RepID=A0A6P6S1A6_9EIME|nr:metacaspase-1-like [Cyclospora cayetanensis]
MEDRLRLSLQILDICGVETPQPLYIKFLWRGDKQKSPLLRVSAQQQVQQQTQAEFLLPYDPETDGSRLLLRVWKRHLLRHAQGVTTSSVSLPALGPHAQLRVQLQLKRFDAAAYQQQLHVQLQQQHQISRQQREQQMHEHHLALQDFHSSQAAYYSAQRQQQQQQQQQQAHNSASSRRQDFDGESEDVVYIHSILPRLTVQEIKEALRLSEGDREKAVDLLLRQEVAAAAASHQQEVQQQQQEAAAGAAAAAASHDSAAAPYTEGVLHTQAQAHPQYPQWTPPMAPPTPSQQQQQQSALLPASALHQPSPFPPHPGRRKALLIGINYIGTRAQLRGCINDAKRMQQLLRGLYGFGGGPTEMVVLTDDNCDPLYKPTRHNILAAMSWLTAGSQPGDALFFHYSGHGARRPDPSGIESDGFDETILPVDFQQKGEIVDDKLHEYLVQPLPSGCRLTAVMDSCHSGSGLDLSFIWNQASLKWKEETNPFYVIGDVQLFSGCEDSQTSADLRGEGIQRAAGGAMTTAFVTALTQMPFSHSYPSLMDALSQSMMQRGLSQRPQLTSSQRFEFNRPFSLTAAIPNSNQFLGRRIRRRCRAPATNTQSALAGGMLAAAGGLAAGFLLAEILDPR